MALYPIKINNKEFKVAIADTDESRAKGLSGARRMGETKGMLFIFPTAVRMNMIMKDMNFGLDFLFLDDKWNIVHMGSLDKDSEYGIYPDVPCHMVIELSQGTIKNCNIKGYSSVEPSGKLKAQLEGVKKFKHGGQFEMKGEKVYEVKVDDIEIDDSKIQILNTEGEVVVNIDNGSRIFSREHTAELIKKFKKGDTKELAEAMINIIDIHDTQKSQYVKK
jgi:uncharacterized membrane protein (UPF0127 family)